jgi:hypothetical protein
MGLQSDLEAQIKLFRQGFIHRFQMATKGKLFKDINSV